MRTLLYWMTILAIATWTLGVGNAISAATDLPIADSRLAAALIAFYGVTWFIVTALLAMIAHRAKTWRRLHADQRRG